jgi:PAP2 superfamily
MSDYSARWVFLAACMLVQAGLLLKLGVGIDPGSAWQVVEAAGQLLFLGYILAALGRRWGRLLAVGADLSLSFAQFLAALAVLTPFSYIAATTNVALLDDDLARLDALLGFHWDSVAAWVADRPALEWTLSTVYFGLHIQTVVLLFLGSLTRPGERNGEPLWLFSVAAVLTVAVFAFTPALGKIGHLGTYQVEMLANIRAGHWTVLDYGKLAGIVNFPSFHTALAILWTYAVRRHLRALAISAPLNAVLIAATPPIGGHYLVDLFAGAAVAGVSILFVRALQRRTTSGGALAGRPLPLPRPSLSAG